MSSMLPIWLLPFWTLGVPLLWGIVDLMQMPRRARPDSDTAVPSARATPGLAYR